ncbi:hypothetical protein [Merismopedia glauca]|uniref:DUF2281 domain-containing protein n=1 Tax=Merismopedia glauca CCAP 1448/3 TaxID=1296344 RepID=A0A2T1C0H8_9CYAN|nr:hypothetical protein [Merismopedia glauca]PSB01704.1 hypothetical protein C7B64_16855 [Merismopedia glauca CCAP 1448/3]
MLRENLKQELDKLNDDQLRKIADFIALIELQSQKVPQLSSLSQTETSIQRAKEFRQWVSQLPQDSISLADEAFSRDAIYVR